MKTFKQQAIAAGFDLDLIEDFIEDLATVKYRAWAENPSIDNLIEYKEDRDSEVASQVRWDAHQRNHCQPGRI